jgi:xanthine dehydrogenase accessory factor
MAVGAAGEVVGSVSGGCVESAVVVEAQDVLASATARTVTFGYSDEDAFAVGLTCGGEIDVFVQRVDAATMPCFGDLAAAVAAEAPAALATVIAGPANVGSTLLVRPAQLGRGRIPDHLGTLGADGLDAAVLDDARGMLSQGQTDVRHYGANGERRIDDVAVFVSSFAPRPRLLVFGAIDFAAAVARAGAFLGYHVTVCDARATFATARRFPQAEKVVVEWPDRFLRGATVDCRTVICVLTHDPKFDVPLLEVALRTDAAYIGAMGSRETHAERLDLLRQRGLTEDELTRLSSPIGLDIGARTPEETAVSIAAEIIQRRWGGSGRPLGETQGAIHRDRQPPVGT